MPAVVSSPIGKKNQNEKIRLRVDRRRPKACFCCKDRSLLWKNTQKLSHFRESKGKNLSKNKIKYFYIWSKASVFAYILSLFCKQTSIATMSFAYRDCIVAINGSIVFQMVLLFKL